MTVAGSGRVRLGFVGGGRGALIGPVHRTAARLDDRFEVAGAVLSSDPAKALADAASLGLPGFASLAEMIEEGGLDAVAIATPNDSHGTFCLARTGVVKPSGQGRQGDRPDDQKR